MAKAEETAIKRMKELIPLLLEASRAYYAEDREIMSNLEYDALYEELENLEKETGTVLAGSPTVTVGYEAVEELPKEEHASPMLSLDKTKDREVLRAFAGPHKTLLSWKMDGLTVVLTYEGGRLFKAVTRGNGVTGEVVTNNAKVFLNLPLRIPYEGTLVLRGEACITYSDFEKINEEQGDAEARYKNPRNLCSGSVRQLNNEITAKRRVRFYAFSLVSAEGMDFQNSHENEMLWLAGQGFEIVPYRVVTGEDLDEALDYFSVQVQKNDFPSDGLVAVYDDIAYGASLGSTAKFPRNAFAFKWADEKAATHLLEIEWSPSRTGLINPVAIFEPVELEGTTVSRASVHNISILKELKLGIGDEILVYKANMIIPQIAENLTGSGALTIPDRCPACGGAAGIRALSDAESLYCTNPDCPAKAIKSFALFVSRDALNIEGVSEATLEKFMAHGLLHDLADLFHLREKEEIITGLDGFGRRSFDKLVEAAEKARHTTLPKLLYGLGIPNIGVATAKIISEACDADPERVSQAEEETLSAIDGIGPVIASGYTAWWRDSKNRELYRRLLLEVTLERPAKKEGVRTLEGKTFVITGSLAHFPNRNACRDWIESLGGKVAGSVSARTFALINNDVTSSSGKNKKAKELGIQILSEEGLLALAGVPAPDGQL